MTTDRIIPYHYRQLSCWIETETHPLDAKLIIVPTQQIGYELTTAMASLSGGWLNLEALPARSVALQAINTIPPASAPSPPVLLSSAGLPFLFEQILSEVQQELGVSLNRAAGAFARTISELRASRITPDEYAAAASGPFAETVLAVYKRYLTWVDSEDVMDEAELFRRATQAVRTLACEDGTRHFRLFDRVAILDEVELSEVSSEFVETLGRCAKSVSRIGQEASSESSLSLSPVMAGRRLSDWPVPTVESIRGGREQNIEVLKAVDAENEIRTVFRSIIESNLSLDCVEIACSVEDPYVRITRQLADRYNMPTTVATGIRAIDTRAGALARAYLLWIIDGRPCTGIVRMLRSGLIRFREASTGKKASVSTMASILAQMPVRGSLEKYQSALARIRSAAEARVKLATGTFREKTVREEIVAFDQVEKYVWPLLALAEEIDGRKTLSDMSSVISTLLYTYAPISHKSEDVDGVKDPEFVARQELIARFEGLARQLNIRLHHSVLIARSMDVISGAVVYARSARSGKLHVSPLSSAGFTGRSHVFVVGLDNQKGAGSLAEDPLFTDGERDAVNGNKSGRMIPLARYRTSSLRDQLTRAVARFDGTVRLIYSIYDVGSNRELGASAALMAVSGINESGRNAICAGSYAPALEGGVHGRIMDRSDMFLAAGVRGDQSDILRFVDTAKIASEYPWMAAGLRSETQRAAEDWTSWDGIIGESGKVRNLFSARSRLSASRLETLMACPYKYFLRYILRMYPRDEPDEDVWMDARTRGSIIHDVFHGFMVQATSESRSLGVEKFESNLDELTRLFLVAIDAYEGQVNVSNSAERVAVLSEFEFASRAFLHDEARRKSSITPKAFELAFGISPGTRQSMNDPTEVFSLNLDGLEFNFQGRIDRIDELENGHLSITDYKTGSSKQYDSADLLNKGGSLQWALYAFAAEQVMGAPVDVSGYLFPNKRELGLRIESDPNLARSEIATLLRQAGLRVQAGHFFQAANPTGACRFCDYQRVCGDTAQRKQQIETKISATQPGDILYESLSSWAYAQKKLTS